MGTRREGWRVVEKCIRMKIRRRNRRLCTVQAMENGSIKASLQLPQNFCLGLTKSFVYRRGGY